MAFERDGYTLYAREQLMRGNKYQTIYFFSKRKPIIGTAVEVPDGYVVVVDKKTGIPFLKRQ